MPFHLPGHRYLGPGTDSFDADPVDEDDRIAREHDLDYSFAVNSNDISAADERAISSFWSDFKSSGNWHSLIGAGGLALKYGAENVVGSIYPRMNNNSSYNKSLYGLRQRYLARYAREHNISYREAQQRQREILENHSGFQEDLADLNRTFRRGPSFQTASDRLNERRGIAGLSATSTQRPSPPDIHDQATLDPEDYFQDNHLFENMDTDVVDGSEQQQRGGGGGQTIGGGPSVMGQSPALQILNNPRIQPQSYTIRHSHLFQTWGYKFHMWKNPTVNKSYLLHYPLAALPVDLLPFYLSPSEFDNLPNCCYIESVFVKVTPKGIRCSFDTGTTMSGSANNQQTLFGISAIGLNHKYLLRHRHVKANATKPMEPSYETITKDHIDKFVNRLWGPQTVAFPNIDFPTCLWTVRSLPFYTAFPLPFEGTNGNTAFNLDTGLFDLTSNTNVFNVLDHKDYPCLNYSYKPKFSPCKVRKNISGTDSVVPATHKWLGNINSVQDVNVSINGGKIQASTSTTGLSWQSENAYNVPIEQGTYKTSHQSPFNTLTQPQCHIGLLPVQSNAPSDTDSSFINASALFYVETEIVFKADINSMFNRANVSAHTDAVYDRQYSLQNMYNVEHYAGLLSQKD